jgi:hypothetical protein
MHGRVGKVGDSGFQDSLSGISRVIADSRHATFATAGTVHRRRTHSQVWDGCRNLELAAIVLTRAATTSYMLRLSLRSGPPLILLRGRLAIHLLLLVHLLLVWILLHHHAGLLLIVHGIWLLLVHHWLLLVLCHGRRGLHWWWRAIWVPARHGLRRMRTVTEQDISFGRRMWVETGRWSAERPGNC